MAIGMNIKLYIITAIALAIMTANALSIGAVLSNDKLSIDSTNSSVDHNHHVVVKNDIPSIVGGKVVYAGIAKYYDNRKAVVTSSKR